MRWASAATQGPDASSALESALAQLRQELGGGEPDLILFFLGARHRAAIRSLRARIGEVLGPAPVLGCTAAGVLGGGREYESPEGLALLGASLPGTTLRTFHVGAEGLPDPDAPPAAWQALAGVSPSEEPAFVLLADPYSFPAESLLVGLDFAYPDAVKVGGLASGAGGSGEQVLLEGARLHATGAVGLVLTGALEMAPAVAQGCRGVGPVLRITAGEGHLLASLDGVPALERVHQVLREASEEDRRLASTSALFLGIETDPFTTGEPAWLVRNFLGRERDGEGLYVGENLRVGRRVRLHVRDRVTSAEDLEHTLAATADGPGAGCRGALLFSCGGRGMGLYGTPDHDTRAFHAQFGPVPVGGFFCAGEIGPVGGATYLHGFTSSFGLFRPRARAGQASA